MIMFFLLKSIASVQAKHLDAVKWLQDETRKNHSAINRYSMGLEVSFIPYQEFWVFGKFGVATEGVVHNCAPFFSQSKWDDSNEGHPFGRD